MKDSKGWDGKLRVGQGASITDPDALEESDHSDPEPPAEEAEPAEPVEPDQFDDGTFRDPINRVAWIVRLASNIPSTCPLDLLEDEEEDAEVCAPPSSPERMA